MLPAAIPFPICLFFCFAIIVFRSTCVRTRAVNTSGRRAHEIDSARTAHIRPQQTHTHVEYIVSHENVLISAKHAIYGTAIKIMHTFGVPTAFAYTHTHSFIFLIRILTFRGALRARIVEEIISMLHIL